ncbi:MAG: hypothetical protein JXR77_17920, partial [Lentisphaeria bacterium]|nr:hypothetical protein [Lentisphaeria bacterium]
MSRVGFISIDQNCHPLWDTLPKLHALAARGWRGRQAIEDVDVAFSRQGSRPGDRGLELLPERFYRGGHSDWGAALFCHDFLGRLPLDVRALEPYTGRTTAALARLLQTDVDALYDRWSPSDNWQLVGPSYAEDSRWHRVIGDVRMAEAGPHVRALVAHAREDLLERFPQAEAQARIRAWFAEEEAALEPRLAGEPSLPLTTLYRDWLQRHLPPGVGLCLTSELLAPQRPAAEHALLALFLEHYEEAAGAYNAAVQESRVGIAPLHLRQGELPFFAVCRRGEHRVRAPLLWDGAAMRAGDLGWPVCRGELPLERMARDGVFALAGKAMLLVLQARLEPGGAPLALPHLGSLYMPAAYAFERTLRAQGLLRTPAYPILRLRLGFLDHWRGCPTIVRPPPYLRDLLGLDEAPASALGEALRDAMDSAEKTLRALADD